MLAYWTLWFQYANLGSIHGLGLTNGHHRIVSFIVPILPLNSLSFFILLAKRATA